MTATIEDALLALSAMDGDRARERNDVGFNGRDTGFGNSLAEQIRSGRSLSPRQKAAAFKMLRTYRVQLERDHGIRYDDLEEPGAPPPAPKAVLKGTLEQIDDATVAITLEGYVPGDAWRRFYDSLPDGRRYDKAHRRILVPLNASTAVGLMQLPATIRVSQGLLDALGALQEHSGDLAELSGRADTDFTVAGLGGELLPFQRAGVQYAVEARNVLIGDEMGLGKTVQALATIWHQMALPAVIVVPAVVKLNWQREARKWLPDVNVAVLSGRKVPKLDELGPAHAELTNAGIYVVNYDVLPAWVDFLKGMGPMAVVFDESHYLKNGKAQRTKAARALAASPGLELRILLTGTAVLNRPIELASQLDVLGVLKPHFGGFWPFAKRYAGAVHTGFGWDLSGATNLDELHAKLRACCYVRRTKTQVLEELPDKRRSFVPIELADRARYQRVLADLKRWLKERELAVLEDVEHAHDIAEVRARAREERMGRQAKLLVQIEALKQVAAEEKLEGALAWIEDFMDSDKKLVLFATHRHIIEKLTNALTAYSPAVITGDTPQEARQAAVDRFQENPHCRIFIGNIQAAGVGITLTAASDVAFLELPWRPGDLDQAEDRCHRIGQKDSVTAWYLLAAGTIEEKIAGMLDQKRAVTRKVHDGAETDEKDSLLAGLVKSLTDDEEEE